MARLATAWSQTSLIPRGREGYRRWRSGGAFGVRVLATSRSHTAEAQAIASRIFGEPAFPSYRSTEGTVYGRASTLEHDTGGWRITETAHEGCLDCLQYVVPAISHAAVTGSLGARYGEDREVFTPSYEGGTRWTDPHGTLERVEHYVRVSRRGAEA